MGNEPFGEEGYSLLADLEGVEAATAAIEHVRRRRRLLREPAMSRKEAVWRANDYLRSTKSVLVADADSAVPDGALNLWVVTCRDPSRSGAGDGGLLEVAADGRVRDLPSAPG